LGQRPKPQHVKTAQLDGTNLKTAVSHVLI
jgi:hypothetical protein